jgi:peptide/nickel transport system substrate-binding protein
MKITRIFWSIMIMLVVASMLFVACAPAASEEPMEEPATEEPTTEAPAAEEPATEAPAAEEPAAGPKTLTVAVGSESYHIRGWTIDTDDAFSMSYYGILETLVKVDYDGNMVPMLAESWEQVDDTTWQFNLRQGVSFTNGEPFNAEAVVKSFDYIINSPTPPRGITADTFTSVEATNEYTVTITTATFDALVPNRLTSPNTGILAPSAYIADSGPIDPYNTGTGPFILTNEIPDQSLTLVKNPDYWGGEVKLDEVTMLLVPDSQIRAGMLQTGEIDIDIHLPVEQLAILEADPDISILRSATPRVTTLDLNMSRPPFDDVKVRQAVAYALDKQAIVDASLEGVGSPAVGPMAPSEGWANKDLAGYPYSPDKAKELLAEAGYAEGDLTVGLWTYPSRANLPLTALAIQDMLGDVGINVEIRLAQYGALEADVLGGNYDMFIVSRNHALDNYDVEGFLSSDYSCDGSYNRAQFCDPTFDSLLSKARGTADTATRYDIYRQLQTILVDEQCVSAFLNHTEILDGVRSNVLNFQIHPLERFVLTADLDVTQ